MARSLIVCFAAFLLFFSPFGYAADGWEPVEGGDNIKAFVKPNPDTGYNMVRLTTTTDISLDRLFAVLADVDGMPAWMESLSTVKVIDRTSPTAYSLHMTYHFPWPYKDRDSVTSDLITRDPADHSITLSFDDMVPAPAKEPDYVRMNHVKGYWRLIPVAGGTTTVVYETDCDPGGNVSAWVVNMFATDTAMKTMVRFLATARNSAGQPAQGLTVSQLSP